MTYRDHLRQAMESMAKEERALFIGYNVRYGRAAGSLANVAEEKLMEMPLSENLMIGAAIGASLDGCLPLVYFERMDFLMLAMDALVNHLDKISAMSGGIHNPAAIIRCVVGNKKVPLFTGATHTQDFSEALPKMISFPVISLRWKTMIAGAYDAAIRRLKGGQSTILVDYKDLWDT